MSTAIAKPIDYDRIMELHREGKSQNVIVAETGHAKQLVNTVIRTLEHVSGEGASASDGIRIVPLDQVVPNPWQPRKFMDPSGLLRLADDIAANGLLQKPLGREIKVIGQIGPAVQLAFGHRRLAAIRLLADRGEWPLEGLPVELADISDDRMFLFALSENSAREQVDPIEELEAIHQALEAIEGLTITQLAANKGVDRSTLSNQLRCLKLPDVVLDVVRQRNMTLAGAREFLCLQNDDHAHIDQMAWVIEEIGNTQGISGLPDFRPKHVRQTIAKIVWRHEGVWRPLESPKARLANVIGNEGHSPSFEVQPYMMMHPEMVHHLPDRNDDGTHAWTCDVRQWQRLQTAATRAANQQAAEQGQEKPAAQQSETPNQRWIAALKTDPAVLAALGGQTPSTATLRNMDPETAQKLGSLAARVSNSDRFNTAFDRFPTFIANRQECEQECTKGAKYMARQAWQGGTPMVKCCTNQSCFNEKCRTGKAVFLEQLADLRAAQEFQAIEMVAEQELTLTDEVASQIVRLVHKLSRAGQIFPREPHTNDPETDLELAHWPDYLLSPIRALGVAPQPRNTWNNGEVVGSQALLLAEKSPQQLRHLAATLLVYLSQADMVEGTDE